MKVVNFTPGIRTNADYTTPEMKNYQSSKKILAELKDLIENKDHLLKGSILLIHLGTHPDRKDKLYDHLEFMIKSLKNKGFTLEQLVEK